MDTKNRLKSLMNERGWTIYRLAKESGVAWTTIRNMFARNTDPSIQTLESLCKGLGISLTQFFDVDNDMGISPEQTQLLHQWGILCEKDKLLITELIISLNEKNKNPKEKN